MTGHLSTGAQQIQQGICPICGKDGFKVVSVHTNKTHGLDVKALRAMYGMTTGDPTCVPEFSARAREVMQTTGSDRAERIAELGRAGKGVPKPYGFTEAGKRRIGQATSERMQSQEMKQKARESLKRTKTPEAIAKWRKSMAVPEMKAILSENGKRAAGGRTLEERSSQAKLMWDRRGRKPCGTRAAYRRGCRCHECVEANRAYKRSQYLRRKGES